jgi:hypothetical protein
MWMRLADRLHRCASRVFALTTSYTGYELGLGESHGVHSRSLADLTEARSQELPWYEWDVPISGSTGEGRLEPLPSPNFGQDLGL